MGLVSVIAKVSGPAGSAELEFLVDSGATYSLLPEAIWKKIGLKPKREMSFSLADGSSMMRRISECLFEFEDNESHTPVILGEGSDVALLGVVTLENMGLILNPFKRQLQPMKMVMA